MQVFAAFNGQGDHLIFELVLGRVAPHSYQLVLHKSLDTAPGAVEFPE